MEYICTLLRLRIERKQFLRSSLRLRKYLDRLYVLYQRKIVHFYLLRSF